MGYSVIAEISSGKESVDAASRMRPDVVLMDIKLGGETNDIDATTQIREQFDVPVVYLTAWLVETRLSEPSRQRRLDTFSSHSTTPNYEQPSR